MKTIKSLNNCPVVVKKPTGIVGGTNTPVKAVTSPTRYTGGLNKAACDVPNSKSKKSY
jgi:hypothetical protein